LLSGCHVLKNLQVNGGLLFWYGKEEGCALARLGDKPYSAAVKLDDFFDQRQADAGIFGFVAVTERLEKLENPLEMLRLDSGAIVGNTESPEFVFVGVVDCDAAIGFVHKPDGVGQELIENLINVPFFANHNGQVFVGGDFDIRGRLNFGKRGPEQYVKVGGMLIILVSGDSGILQDCVHKFIHSSDSSNEQGDLLAAVVVEFVVVVIEQPLSQSTDTPKGRFEIVGGQMSELAKLSIGLV
jgi:hypothetical protein